MQTSADLIVLRDLPGVAGIAGLCRQPAKWDYPTVLDTMATVNAVSVSLFAITRYDTFVDEDDEFFPDEGGLMLTAESYEQRFNAVRAEWPEQRAFFEAIGWDISDGQGNELICAHWFSRQIIAVAFELVEGARFTPDGSGQWWGDDHGASENEETLEARLRRDVDAFFARKSRRD